MTVLSIIVPVFNEEKTIGELLNRVRSVILPPGIKKEIIVINDGSTDHSNQELEKFKQFSEIKIFNLPLNRGKTHAVVHGLTHATGDVFIIQDADLEYSPSYYPMLLMPILEKKSQIVYGSRFMGKIQQMTFINRLANQISNISINLLYNCHLTDFHTCFKMFTRQAYNSIDITSKNFSFDTEITAKFLEGGFQILELPIDYVARKQGKKMNWFLALESYGELFKVKFGNGFFLNFYFGAVTCFYLLWRFFVHLAK